MASAFSGLVWTAWDVLRSLVTKGSPVRVRASALSKPRNAGFRLPAALRRRRAPGRSARRDRPGRQGARVTDGAGAADAARELPGRLGGRAVGGVDDRVGQVRVERLLASRPACA